MEYDHKGSSAAICVDPQLREPDFILLPDIYCSLNFEKFGGAFSAEISQNNRFLPHDSGIDSPPMGEGGGDYFP